MQKLAKIKNRLYCLLVTFDPEEETLNIIDINSVDAQRQPEATGPGESKHLSLLASLAQSATRSLDLGQASPDQVKRRYQDDELLNREQAAEYLGVSPKTLAMWKCTNRYNLEVVKIGRLVRYRKRHLDEFIENMRKEQEQKEKRRR
ncbi:MAG: helix-turn-helix domain-containing protein [Candidatus Obscuribacterales bacterium]